MRDQVLDRLVGSDEQGRERSDHGEQIGADHGRIYPGVDQQYPSLDRRGMARIEVSVVIRPLGSWAGRDLFRPGTVGSR